jgi:hypothetical protein
MKRSNFETQRMKGICLGLIPVVLLIIYLALAWSGPRNREMTETSLQEAFDNATTPMGVLLRDRKSNCPTCDDAEAVVARVVRRFPKMEFITTYTDVKEPVFVVLVPGVGAIYRDESFHPTKPFIARFVQARLKIALDVQALADRSAVIQRELDEASQPFNARIAEILKKAKAIETDVRRQEEEATAGLTGQIAALRRQSAEAARPFNEELALLKKALKAVRAGALPQAATESHPDSSGPAASDEEQGALVEPGDEDFASAEAKTNSALTIGDGSQDALKAKIAALTEQVKAATELFTVQIDTLKFEKESAIRAFHLKHPEVRQHADEARAALLAEGKSIDEERHAAIADGLAKLNAIHAEIKSIIDGEKGDKAK